MNFQSIRISLFEEEPSFQEVTFPLNKAFINGRTSSVGEIFSKSTSPIGIISSQVETDSLINTKCAVSSESHPQVYQPWSKRTYIPVELYADNSALAEKERTVIPLHPSILMESHINMVKEKGKDGSRTPSSIFSPRPVFNPGESNSLIVSND